MVFWGKGKCLLFIYNCLMLGCFGFILGLVIKCLLLFFKKDIEVNELFCIWLNKDYVF